MAEQYQKTRTFSRKSTKESHYVGAIEVRISQDDIIIISNPKKTGGLNKELRIDRVNKVIQEAKGFKKNLSQEVYQLDVFLGIIQILDMEFLVFVETSELVCKLLEHEIYQVTGLIFIQLDNNKVISKEISQYINGVQDLFSKCHYYSYTYPLTTRFSKFAQNKENPEISETDFQWNYKMTHNHFIDIDRKWHVQLIQGYVGQIIDVLGQTEVQLILITRRSHQRSGTRFTHRGIDSEGFVANYCETEQIIISENKLTSYVMVRGSVPLLWQQTGSGGQYLRIFEGIEMSKKAFIKHFNAMHQQYGNIVCINLMKENQKNEKKLTQAFEKELQSQSETLKNVNYEFYDFAKNKSTLNNKIQEYRKRDVEKFSHFFYDTNKKVVAMNQNTVYRINCKDCLDRTNTFMMKQALISLENIIQEFGGNIKKEINGDPLTIMDEANPHSLLKQFKLMWADQGDQLSFIYAGSQATTTNLTKNGYKGFTNKLTHKLTSLGVAFTRVINSKYQDYYKQEYIDIFLCNHLQSSPQIYEEITQQFLQETTMFIKQNLQIQVMSYNVENLNLQEEEKNDFLISGFFNFEYLKENFESLPQLIVIGLQQITEYKLFKDQTQNHQESIQFWKNLIIKDINKQIGIDKYVIVDMYDMQGSMLIVFGLKEITNQITEIYHDSIKISKQYGSVEIHFKFFDQDFCFINVYLPDNSVEKRQEAINEIHEKAFQQKGVGRYKKLKIEDHDYIVMLGDFNFSLDMKQEEALNLIRKCKEYNHINQLLYKDEGYLLQFQKYKQVNKYFRQYTESPITFLPTYLNTNPKKSDPPAWKHRIFVRNNNEKQILIKPSDYKYERIDQSKAKVSNNHRPVSCNIQMQLQVIDQEKSDEKLIEILKERKTAFDTELEQLLNIYHESQYKTFYKESKSQSFMQQSQFLSNSLQDKQQQQLMLQN